MTDHDPHLGTGYGAAKFGSRTITPKILAIYAGIGGYRVPDQPLRLNRGTATALRAAGYTMVRVRHRLRTHDISLSRYLDTHRL
ncbi:hypothetical protein GCM10010988_22620 [Cnuibacter physcomitrellae]|uniref:Uncharacterized protein n=1 Tax=Cnuibacter physcomitrellae TaxID=1619308 RepID=A0A1X9LP75_9MICO|nr:hypothetical protein [Cnuibacter physcomitrellae]ARJ06927.1 hypothetical protein B5808_18115 [Cnuibacter physcomitrellae]GGI39148.1 hypothetical protein GCM10010988_22620 [Cnuibacter physcomitrellae]